MRKRMLFVFNPSSGKGMVKRKLYEIIDVFTHKYQVTVYPTRAAHDGYKHIVRNYEKFDVIVCAGGDGTLNEVVRAVMHIGTNTPIGYIPCGSTNDFGASLEIPKNLTHAAHRIMAGKPRYCDLGFFNKKTFNYVAAFGAFTDVSYATSQELKNLFGHSAYVLEAAKKLFSIKSYEMTVECNGKRVHGEFIYGMIANSHYIGGVKGITGKHVKLNDGKFEVMLIKKPQNAFQMEQIMSGILMQNITENKEVCISTHTNDISFLSREKIDWTLDGEYGGSVDRVHAGVIHNAFRIICDKEI